MWMKNKVVGYVHYGYKLITNDSCIEEVKIEVYRVVHRRESSKISAPKEKVAVKNFLIVCVRNGKLEWFDSHGVVMCVLVVNLQTSRIKECR